jgi:methylated-DNA-[protein]-cysteine S-methyltransferase
MNAKNNFDASSSFESKIGTISLFAMDNQLVALNISGNPVADSGSSPVLAKARKQLERYFAGKSRDLDVSTLLQGTEFQKRVWAEIAKIGFGETLSYQQIAEKIGNPKASRAVGAAVGANPVPLFIGCHRVLGSTGKITGYSGGEGLPTKRLLLELEGISAKE